MMEVTVMGANKLGGKGKGPKYDEYQVKEWADLLLRAEEIKHDPEKMKLVAPLLAKKGKAIRSLEDLRALSKNKASDAENTSETMASGEEND